jgi:hypothetical protein
MKVSKWLVIAIATVLVATSAHVLTGHTMAPRPTMKDLAQVWMGGDRNYIWYSRLELLENGTGTFIVQYLPDQPPQAYKVTSTRLTGYDVSLTVAAIDRGAEGITVEGDAAPYELGLKIRGTSGVWESDVTFYQAKAILATIEAVNRRARELVSTK